MENQLVGKTNRAISPRAAFIQWIKSEISALGCNVRVSHDTLEIWVTHRVALWSGYAEFQRRDLKAIKEAWIEALQIARSMDADFRAGKI